jgi:hypothetical protein
MKKCDVNNRNAISSIMAIMAVKCNDEGICTAHTNAMQEIDARLR